MTEETNDQDLIMFKGAPQIRRVWHKEQLTWYYSVVDVVAYLTNSSKPSQYWYNVRNRMSGEGAQETLAQIEELPMRSADGKLRKTDAVSRQTLLRLIQSVPSPRAEGFKMWLAQVGEERIEEIEHSEDIVEQIRAQYRRQGRDERWIDERIKNQMVRNELTDEWRDRGAQDGTKFAILTNELSKGTFGLSVEAHKRYKGLPSRMNLRDHMIDLELVLCSLSEVTAMALHRKNDSQGFSKLHQDTREAGQTAGQARQLVEKTIGGPVVSPESFLPDRSQKAERVSGKHKGKKRLSPQTESQLPTQPTLFEGLE